MKNGEYHYTESGLDSVYLVGGFKISGSGDQATVVIQDLDGLHEAIGRHLVCEKKRLSGKEIRFLRTELLMSQSTLATLLHVDEQTVARWEKGRSKLPGTADATLRLLYLEHVGGNEKISSILRRIADIEDYIDQRMDLTEQDGHWMAA